MTKRIPIKAAKDLLKTHDLKQVIIFGWDGERTHVITAGKSAVDCEQAAAGANKIKQGWGWPENTLTEPARVKKLLARIKELEEKVDGYGEHIATLNKNRQQAPLLVRPLHSSDPNESWGFNTGNFAGD